MKRTIIKLAGLMVAISTMALIGCDGNSKGGSNNNGYVYPGGYPGSGYGNTLRGNMQVMNIQLYRNFLESTGICQNGGWFNTCNQMDNASYAQLSVGGTSGSNGITSASFILSVIQDGGYYAITGLSYSGTFYPDSNGSLIYNQSNYGGTVTVELAAAQANVYSRQVRVLFNGNLMLQGTLFFQ